MKLPTRNEGRSVQITLWAGGVVALLALFGYGLTKDPYVLPSPLVGRSAADLALAVMEPEPVPGLGKWEGRDTVRLNETLGRPVVLNFWASWCVACRQEHPVLSAAAKRYRDLGVLFYGVLFEDQPGTARRFIEEMGGQSYPTLLDPDSRTAIEYGVYGVPETFFIASNGLVAHKHIGPVTRPLLSRWIDSLLSIARDGWAPAVDDPFDNENGQQGQMGEKP